MKPVLQQGIRMYMGMWHKFVRKWTKFEIEWKTAYINKYIYIYVQNASSLPIVRLYCCTNRNIIFFDWLLEYSPTCWWIAANLVTWQCRWPQGHDCINHQTLLLTQILANCLMFWTAPICSHVMAMKLRGLHFSVCGNLCVCCQMSFVC